MCCSVQNQTCAKDPLELCLMQSRTRGQKRKRVPTGDDREDKMEEPLPRERRQRQSAALQKKPKADDTRTDCTSCRGPGDNENLVVRAGAASSPPVESRDR
ncbi:PHD finger protein 14 [Liparis tanakae]|uniref:PHD finger protein 14 n=1 Tax=Liparis tanakae TaxID=230148 RepID=A0A4Z2FCM5_9TELE|nr:PHD finger protein 14 [Liparis tanakae]